MKAGSACVRPFFCETNPPAPRRCETHPVGLAGHTLLENIYNKEVTAMICTTIREGVDCPFMAKNGCSYNGGVCHQVVEQCQGCNRAAEYPTGWYCATCPEPSQKWVRGHCNMATHVSLGAAGNQQKINPLKASKRSRK